MLANRIVTRIELCPPNLRCSPRQTCRRRNTHLKPMTPQLSSSGTRQQLKAAPHVTRRAECQQERFRWPQQVSSCSDCWLVISPYTACLSYGGRGLAVVHTWTHLVPSPSYRQSVHLGSLCTRTRSGSGVQFGSSCIYIHVIRLPSASVWFIGARIHCHHDLLTEPRTTGLERLNPPHSNDWTSKDWTWNTTQRRMT